MKRFVYAMLAPLWLVSAAVFAGQPVDAYAEGAPLADLQHGHTLDTMQARAEQVEQFLATEHVLGPDDAAWQPRVDYDLAANGDESYPKLTCQTSMSFSPSGAEYNLRLEGRALLRDGQIIAAETFAAQLDGADDNMRWYIQSRSVHHSDSADNAQVLDGATVRLSAAGALSAWFEAPRADGEWQRAKSRLSASCLVRLRWRKQLA